MRYQIKHLEKLWRSECSDHGFRVAAAEKGQRFPSPIVNHAPRVVGLISLVNEMQHQT